MCCPGKIAQARPGREHCPASSSSETLGTEEAVGTPTLVAPAGRRCLQDVEMPFPGRGGCQSLTSGAAGT